MTEYKKHLPTAAQELAALSTKSKVLRVIAVGLSFMLALGIFLKIVFF